MCRTPIPVNWTRVDELLEAGCLGTEIAAYFGMHPETFYDKVVKEKKVAFSEYSAQKKATGEALIREAQFKKAIKKLDNSMLIWLGKQRLGQKEHADTPQATQEILQNYETMIEQIRTLQSSKTSEQNANGGMQHKQSEVEA